MLLNEYKITMNIKALDNHTFKKVVYARADSVQSLKRQKLIKHLFETTKNSLVSYEIEDMNRAYALLPARD